MTLEHVRVSEKAKQQLITLKRRTGVENWNVLCRWAFCISLSEKSLPPHEDIVTDSSIEMSWKTFGGENSEVYLALLKLRIKKDYNIEDMNNINYYFKLHLHRGISYLSNRVNNLKDLLELAI